MIIDTTYFILDINLPVGTYSDLTEYITRFEPEVLTKLLGYEAYTLMAANPTKQRWKDLIEGKEYTVDWDGRDQRIKWNGLKNSAKISLISDYVYYWYMRSKATLTGNVGEVKPKQENSFNAEAVAKVMNAWTRMRELYGYSGQTSIQPSAYNFLLENEDTYPEWVFSEIGRINSHDL